MNTGQGVKFHAVTCDSCGFSSPLELSPKQGCKPSNSILFQSNWKGVDFTGMFLCFDGDVLQAFEYNSYCSLQSC